MRLHSLTVTAFGPFATEQTVDFDLLSASGLFLLEGPTGAGKTTVLDAVTFALYGPGERGGDDRLQSHFAESGTRPEVALEFSVAGVRHRVTRSPEYQRPKKRGDGYITQAAAVHLQRHEHGRWVSRSSNKAEVGDMLAEVLGLTREQFTQVVLLPQGEFAKFLRAADDDRQRLLTKLFGTELYDQITDELDRRRTAAGRNVEEASQRVREAVAAAAEAVGLDASARAELVALGVNDRDGRFAELEAELRCARTAADRLAGEALANAERSRVECAAAATLAECQAAAQAASRAGDRHAERRIDADPRQLRERESSAMTAAAQLEHLIVREARLPQLRLELARAQQVAADTELELTALAARVESLPPESRAVELELNENRTRAAEAAALSARITDIEKRLEAAQSRDSLEPRLRAARDAVRAAHDAALEAKAAHLDLRECQLSGYAAVLAEQLVDGEPCAVCGSPAHPAPTAHGESAVTIDQVRQAAETQGSCEEALARATATLREIEREYDAATAVADGSSVESRGTELAELRSQWAASTAAQARVDQLAARLQALANERDGLSARNTELSARVAALTVDVQTHQRELATLEAELASASDGCASVGERHQILQAEAQAAAEQARCLAEWQREADRLADSEWRAVTALAEAASAAGLDAEADATELLAVASARAEATADAARMAAADAARARHAVERLRLAVDDVRAAQLQYDHLSSDVAPVIYLAKLAKGTAGTRRTALTTYVLRHWFEKVVQAANVRLATMSSSRYELIRVDEGRTAATRSGLTLEVIDRHTGEQRSPRSLSGGETFYTSLALALGLADVVKAEAGGVDLDTLFIDEGFGSLDADTLDQVMSVVDDLRDRGRVVGIVSHVSELKDRVAERVEVRRLPNGSSALRVVA